MKFAIVDDRGLNDLERVNDTKDKLIASLKHDNKSLAKQVSDLIEEKKLRTLDNSNQIWYNRTMKNIMIALLVLCFTATVGNTNESNIINKATTHISNEIQNTKEYQKKSWADSKIQFANTKAMIKSWFVKN